MVNIIREEDIYKLDFESLKILLIDSQKAIGDKERIIELLSGRVKELEERLKEIERTSKIKKVLKDE